MINGLGSIGGVPMTVSTITVYENNVVPTGTQISSEFISQYLIGQIAQHNTDGAYLLLPNNAIARAWANTTVAQTYVNFMSNGNNAGGHLSVNINSISITGYITSNDWKPFFDTDYYHYSGLKPAGTPLIDVSVTTETFPLLLEDMFAANTQSNMAHYVANYATSNFANVVAESDFASNI
jgi:hypothetical protein